MAAMNGRNGRRDKAANKARPTLDSLTKNDSPDSYALLGDMDEDLPQSPDLGGTNMFRTISKIEKGSTMPQAKATVATTTPTLSPPTTSTSPSAQNHPLKQNPSDPKAVTTMSSTVVTTPTETPVPAKPLQTTKTTDSSQDPLTATPQSSPANVGAETKKKVVTPKVDLTLTQIGEPGRRQTLAEPPKKPVVSPERRQTMAAPAATSSKVLPGGPGDPGVKPIPQGAGVAPATTSDKPAVVPTTSAKLPAPSTKNMVTNTMQSSPTTTTIPTTSPAMITLTAAGSATSPSPSKTPAKPEEDMPKKTTPPLAVVPTVIESTDTKPKAGILKSRRTRTNSDDKKEVQIQEPAPPLKRQSVTLDPYPVGETLPADPDRSDKINKRKLTQYVCKGQELKVEIYHEHEPEPGKEYNPDQHPRRRVAFNVTDDEEPHGKNDKVKKHRTTTVLSQIRGFDEHADIGTANDLIENMHRADDDERTQLLENEEPQRAEPPKEKKKRPKWDSFESNPVPENDKSGGLLFDFMRKFFKLITIFFCFIIVCGGAAIHKATVLFAASQVDNSYNYTCVRYLNLDTNATKKDFYKCIREGFPKDWDSSIPSCIQSDFPKIGNLGQMQLCVDIQARWIWCLVLIIGTPEVFVFIRCLWIISFKKRRNPNMDALFVVLLTETLSLLGTCCFVFVVLPSMRSSVHGLALMVAAGFLPSLLNALNRPEDETCRNAQRVFDIIALLCQLSGLVFWPIMIGLKLMADFDQSLIWSIPLSLVLMSFTWWVNYIDGASRLGLWTKPLVKLKKRIRKARTKIYLIVSVWKMVIVVCGMFLFACVYQKIPFEDLFSLNRNKCDGKLTAQDLPGQKTDWVFVWFLNLITSLTSYFCARAAAKVLIQFQSYAMPLILVTPMLVPLLLFGCHAWVLDNCYFYRMMPEYLTFDCRRNTELLDILTKDHIWVMYVWWLAQLWVTKHIWFQDNDKLAKTSKLFFNPLYGGVIHEQWLVYNRCVKDKNITSGTTVQHRENKSSADVETQQGPIDEVSRKEKQRKEKELKDSYDEVEEGRGDKERRRIKEERRQDEIPMIYICATMWHESKTEMKNMLKSIFRLDIDQCTRRKTQEYLDMPDRDFYNFEAHIFFDNCMDREKPYTMFHYVVNEYVKRLVATVDDAASIIYGTKISVGSPEKYPTPYGGRLVWTMPGGNQIICHLKDKEKIRIKKRWSQVMYMYYFLGFKLFCKEVDAKRKQIRADNTFLLALDGDVDFVPGALQLLVDIMKKEIKVGAACGRIHPTGSGPMVWYQMFEYAMGHWMQKATEHVLGCVLCSPGCFSLFRGSAIMDDNVMQKYTTTSEEARHLVQYDQGEDRWLCTLLLQQGHRVEYSAASDSYTFAPEEFNEFFNQRRRWTPSTMANVMDLLTSCRRTVKVNENISMLYIAYQAALMGSSLLGTGTIFLMIVGALSVAVKIDTMTSFIINVIPLVMFIVLCFTVKSDVQLIVAYIMTVAYGLVQILVLIAIIIQMTDEGVGSPTFIFFVYVAGTFVLAAILHPQEWYCVIHGLLYFILVPSMYMLLMIYSLTNLNDVSWGTREAKKTKAQKEEEKLKKEAEEEAEKKEEDEEAEKKGHFERFKDFIKSKSDSTLNKEDGWTLGIGNCFRFICCPRPVQEDKTHLNRIFDKINDQTTLIQKQKKNMKKMAQNIEVLGKNQEVYMDMMESDEEEEEMEEAAGAAAKNKAMSIKRKMSRSTRRMSVIPMGGLSVESDAEEEKDEEEREKEEEKRKKEEAEEKEKEEYKKNMKNELTNPVWIKDTGRLGEGRISFLPGEEETFFQDLIETYLTPEKPSKKTQDKVKMELTDLKNKVSIGYLLMNATFISVIFILQQNKDKLSIDWPWGDNLRLEPIGFMFLVFFVVIMLLQTIGMLTHRMGTFLHIATHTQLMPNSKDNQGMVNHMVDMVKSANETGKKDRKVTDDDNLSTTSETDSEYSGNEEVTTSRRKSTIYRLEEGFAKRSSTPQRRPTIALDQKIDMFLTKMDNDVIAESPEMLTEKYKQNGVFEYRKSTAMFQLVKERRVTLHRYKSWEDTIGDGQGLLDVNTDRGTPSNDLNIGYGRIKRNSNAMPNGSPFWQDPAESEETNHQQQRENPRQIPLDERKVSRFSMSPMPDYSLIDEVSSGSSQQKHSNASNGSSLSLPKEDYDDNDRDHLLPSHEQKESDIELTVIRHTAQVEDPPVDYDISGPDIQCQLGE